MMNKDKRSAISAQQQEASDERRSIHQFVPGMMPGDAVSNHALEIQKCLRKWGYESEIYSPFQHVSSSLKSICRDASQFNMSNGMDQAVIYHFSIGSELTDLFVRLKAKKVMIYHNITPHHYFIHFNAEKTQAAYLGRKQLAQLANVADLALGDSDYNRKELEALGYTHTGVLPLFIDMPMHEKNSKKGTTKNILFVGRFVPNKKIEDVIKAFYYYQKTIEPNSALWLVGSVAGMEKYVQFLKVMVRDLKLNNVIFTGHISEEEKARYFSNADLYLCMSEHEGFCVPVLEAISYQVPVVAYAAAAVPETLGEAGVIVKEKDFPAIAELIHLVSENKELKELIIEKQNERLKDFNQQRVEAVLKEHLSKIGVGNE